MKPITRTLAAVTTAGVASLASITAALAGPVTPIVSNPTAAAVTAGVVPPMFIPDFAVDVQPTSVSVTKTVTNAPDGAETADGAAAVDLDTTDINASIVRSRSQVSSAASSPPAPEPTPAMTDGSVAGFSATLSTAGLSPGSTATVGLQLTVNGSLVYTDPSGTATTSVIEDIAVPDISANVSVILALANVFLVTDPIVIPDPLPLRTLFNGSATLRSPMATSGGTEPDLMLEGDWVGRDSDFTRVGTCTLAYCELLVQMMLSFPDVQSLGFGETFDIGLLLQTNADAISDTGRMAASLFFDSASVEVTLTALDAQVPEPGTLALLALAIVGLALARRRNLH